MKISFIPALILASSTVIAQYDYTYDPSTGNEYHTSPGYNGSTEVDGYNYNTGSTWNTTIERDGDMNGVDSDGNHWDYDSGTETYYNYGTGKTCTGSGDLRTCY